MAATLAKTDLGGQGVKRTTPLRVQANGDLHAVGTAGNAVTLTINADADTGICLSQIFFGFSAANPAAGTTVTVKDGSTTIAGPFPVALTQSTQQINFEPSIQATRNSAVTVVVSAPGTTSVAYVGANAWVEK